MRPLFTLLVFLNLLLGCSDPNAGLVPLAAVEGTVQYQGKPLAGAIVTFIRPGMPLQSFGTTDAAGHFKLTTRLPNDGAFEGENQVTIAMAPATQSIATDAPPDAETYFRQLKAAETAASKQPPALARYAHAETSKLRFTVRPGPNFAPFTLESQ